MDFTVQILTIKAQVNWLGQGECTGDTTPRQCAAGNLNGGDACSLNTECDRAVPGDMAGRCGPIPCQNDSDCRPDDICGTEAARLVYASALVDPKNLDERGVVLFDNGEKLVDLPGSGGVMVFTGDEVSHDGIYTRQFAINNATLVPAEDCITLAPILPADTPTNGVTSFPLPRGITLDFKVEAVDVISGAARLTTVESGLPTATEAMCCSISGFEFCNSTDPICR